MSSNLMTFMVLGLTWGCWAAPCLAGESAVWSRYNNWEISDLKVEGAPRELASDLRRGLEVTGHWSLLRGRQRPPFSTQLLARDLQRIRIYLAERGYPGASVVPEANPSAEGRRLGLVIRIVAGEPVRIAEIIRKGWPEGLALPDTSQAGYLTVGPIFQDEEMRRGVDTLQDYLHDMGYAEARLTAEVHSRGTGQVLVQFNIEAGELYFYDDIQVEGCSPDLVPLAERIIDLEPGRRFDGSRLAQAVRDLRQTQLFRQVDLKTVRTGPGKLRVEAALGNGRMRTWDASVGTWSDNPWKVRSGWTHRNLFGRGRGFNAVGSFATHEYEAGIGVFWLGWLAPRALTRLSLDVIAQNEDAYRSREYRSGLVQSFRPGNRDILNVGTAISQSRIDEFEAGTSGRPEPEGRLWEVWIDRRWNRTNDPLFATHGGFLKINATCAEPWLWSEVPYASGQADAVRYVDMPLGMVLSGRLRLGVAVPLAGADEVMANRRFQAGGYNTHRGYARHGLGPRDSEGRSRGGEAVALLGGEFRFPVFWLLEGALFLDSGNLWAAADDINLGEYPVAVGGDLGLRTPMGPVRLGYAFNVADRIQDQPRRLWHFGIGYPW